MTERRTTVSKKLLVAGLLAIGTIGGGVAVAKANDQPTRNDRNAAARGVDAAGDVTVVDADGATRGTASDRDLSRMQDIAGRFLDNAGIELAAMHDGKPRIDDAAAALGDAVMTLEAVPVHGPDGTKIVGYFGGTFIEASDYRQARAEAEATVLKATGKPYPAAS
jgi:hypothetical protein